MLKDLTIIKAGTGVLTNPTDGQVDRGALVHLVAAISELILNGHRCLLVSSGAVGSGVSALKLTEYPTDIPTRQACAAIGQARLMRTYTSLFGHFNLTVAQILLTAFDLKTPKSAENIFQTLTRLNECDDIIPIINENDTVATRELSFGDNDMLTVRLAKLIGAKRVILLTSVDGLIDPSTKSHIPVVSDIDTAFQHVREDRGKFAIGGMASKLKAVQFALDHKIETHIAHGRHPSRLPAIIAGNGLSTKFIPPSS